MFKIDYRYCATGDGRDLNIKSNVIEDCIKKLRIGSLVGFQYENYKIIDTIENTIVYSTNRYKYLDDLLKKNNYYEKLKQLKTYEDFICFYNDIIANYLILYNKKNDIPLEMNLNFINNLNDNRIDYYYLGNSRKGNSKISNLYKVFKLDFINRTIQVNTKLSYYKEPIQ